MKIIPWSEWLNEYIPYYEGERHRERFLDDPPASVLIVDILDRATRHVPGQHWETWDELNRRLHAAGYRYSPMFLERDTRQEWYWAFWSEKELLLLLLKID